MIQINISRCPPLRMPPIYRDNAMKGLIAAIGVFGVMTSAAAQAPVAIVEDVQGNVSGVEVMDYVVPGKVIKLGPKASIVLGYLKSCWRETITGGLVVVGTEQSMVHLSDIQRVKVDCDVNAVELQDREVAQSGASTFRSLGAGQEVAQPTLPTLYGLSPIVEVKGGGALIIERLDAPGERYAVTLTRTSLVRGKFYDFAKSTIFLTAGGTYAASLGSRKITFKVDPRATPGSTPIIGRLLRL